MKEKGGYEMEKGGQQDEDSCIKRLELRIFTFFHCSLDYTYLRKCGYLAERCLLIFSNMQP